MEPNKIISININPQRFSELDKELDRVQFVDEVVEHIHDEPDIRLWLQDVLMTESKKKKPERDLIFRLVEVFNEDISESSNKELLGRLFSESSDGSPVYDAIKSILIQSLSDDLKVRRSWAVDNLCISGDLQGKDTDSIEKFLIAILRDNDALGAFRQNAALGLGKIDSKDAVSALMGTARELLRKSVSDKLDLYDEIMYAGLCEKIAYSLGLTGSEEAVPLLFQMQVFSKDSKVQTAALDSINKIEEAHTPKIFAVFISRLRSEQESVREAAEKFLKTFQNTTSIIIKKLIAKKTKTDEMAAIIKEKATEMMNDILRMDIFLKKIQFAAANSDALLFQERIIEDAEHVHRFELTMLANKRIQVTLINTKELNPPDPLQIDIYTNVAGHEVVPCRLEKDNEELSMYGYTERLCLELENVKGIRVRNGK